MSIILYGWYIILNNTIYIYRDKKDSGIGPVEHSFFITFLLHGINVWNIVSYISVHFYGFHISLTVMLAISLIIFLLGYFIYFPKQKIYNLIYYKKRSTNWIVLSIMLSISYGFFSIYLMLKIGDYVREVLQ